MCQVLLNFHNDQILLTHYNYLSVLLSLENVSCTERAEMCIGTLKVWLRVKQTKIEYAL